MWLKSVLWFGWYQLKYLCIVILIGGILCSFLPVVGPIITILLVLGSFSAAYGDFKKEKLPMLKAQKIRKTYKKLGYEFEGFDQMLNMYKSNSRFLDNE